MIASTLFNFAEIVFKFGNEMWASLSATVAQVLNIDSMDLIPPIIRWIFELFNIDTTKWAEFVAPFLNLTIAEIILGAVSVTLFYTLIKYLIGIVTGS